MTNLDTSYSESLKKLDAEEHPPVTPEKRESNIKIEREWWELNKGAFSISSTGHDSEGHPQMMVLADYRGEEKASVCITFEAVEDGCALWCDHGDNRNGGRLSKLAELFHLSPPKYPPSTMFLKSSSSESSKEKKLTGDERKEAIKKASDLWRSAVALDGADVPYLSAKHITHDMLTLTHAELRISRGGFLLCPMYNLRSGSLVGVQGISNTLDDEGKWAKINSGVVGSAVFWSSDNKAEFNQMPFVLCEGVATAISIAAKVVNVRVVCCFGAGNIPDVLKLIRKHDKRIDVYIASDRDETGEECFEKCKTLCKDVLSAIPPYILSGMGKDVILSKKDWNDNLISYPDEMGEAFKACMKASYILRAQLQGKYRDENINADNFLAELKTREQTRDEVFENIPNPVDGLIQRGITIFAGASKSGKTTACFQLACAISAGMSIWDLPVDKRPVLYLAMEDGTDKPVNKRLDKVEAFYNRKFDEFTYTPKAWVLGAGTGAMREIIIWIVQHPNTVIFVDVWAKAKPAPEGGEDAYITAYAEIAPFREICNAFPDVSIVFLHHTNKQGDVSGSEGRKGAVDANLILRRNRDNGIALIERQLREGDDGENIMLHWEKPFFKRLSVDELNALAINCSLSAESTITERIYALVSASSEGWTAKELADKVGCLIDTARTILRRLVSVGDIRKVGGKYYSTVRYDETLSAWVEDNPTESKAHQEAAPSRNDTPKDSEGRASEPHVDTTSPDVERNDVEIPIADVLKATEVEASEANDSPDIPSIDEVPEEASKTISITGEEQNVLNLIGEAGTIYLSELATQVGDNVPELRKIVSSLIERGAVMNGKDGLYLNSHMQFLHEEHE